MGKLFRDVLLGLQHVHVFKASRAIWKTVRRIVNSWLDDFKRKTYLEQVIHVEHTFNVDYANIKR